MNTLLRHILYFFLLIINRLHIIDTQIWAKLPKIYINNVQAFQTILEKYDLPTTIYSVSINFQPQYIVVYVYCGGHETQT